MNKPLSFGLGLTLTLAVTWLGYGLLALAIPALRTHTGFFVTANLAMLAFCLMLYRLASAAARHPRGQAFIGIVMVSVFLKMLMCLALIVGYKKLAEPSDVTFLWPFLLLYVAFTVFEVIFMDRLGRQKPNTA